MSLNSAEADSHAGLSSLDIKRLNHPKWGHQLAGVFLAFIGMFGFIENFLVIITFITNKNLLSATNVFTLGIALGDMCMVCFGNPFATLSALNGKMFAGESVCKFEGFVVYLFGLSQLHLLTAVSVDRYIVIVKPSLATKITKQKAWTIVLGCFGMALLWALFPFFGWSSYGLELTGVFCGLLWDDRSLSNRTYIIAITIFCFCIPLGIMIFCYYHVFMTVKAVNKNTRDMSSRLIRRNLRLERKLLKSCFLMCAVFWMVWMPYAVVSFIQAFGDPESVSIWMAELPSAATKSQVVWNPLIYVATNTQFRSAFYQSIPCRGLREKLVNRDDVQRPESRRSSMDDNQQQTVSPVSCT